MRMPVAIARSRKTPAEYKLRHDRLTRLGKTWEHQRIIPYFHRFLQCSRILSAIGYNTMTTMENRP